MKILHLSKFYPPSRGGLEDVVARQAEGAVKAGHAVTVICGRGPDESERGHLAETRNGVNVVRLPTPFSIWSQPIIRGYVREAKREADVIHIHHPHPLADIALLRSVARPTVITHHSDIRRQALVRPLISPLLRRVLNRASAVAVPTRSHISVSAELKGYEAKCRVIPFGVDHERFKPEGVARPASFKRFGDDPVAIWVGRMVGYKGLDVLMDAVTGSSLRVVLVGSGPLEAEVRRAVSDRKLSANIELAGQVSAEDLPTYYNAADYFVFPSTTPAEMFGISLAEALACGLPVVTTALPTGVSEVRSDQCGLEVPPGDAAELRATMQVLHNDPELRARMGAAGRARVEERFTLDGMVRAHIELYESIASVANP